MFKIIFLLILVGIALAFFIGRPGQTIQVETDQADQYRRPITVPKRVSLTKIGFVPLALAMVLFALWSVTQIHAKEIGVGVSFGK